MMITAETPSSITERPLLSPGDNVGNRKLARAWYKRLRPPYSMLAVSCVQVALYCTLKDLNWLLFDPQRQVEVWRFVTYMLLHKDYIHLAQNILLQCLFGIYLETMEASWKVLVIYIVSGMGGALGAAALGTILIVGASAGVYALLLSYVSHLILNYTMKYRLRLIACVTVIITSDIVYCAFHHFQNASPTISGGAHLFGALYGLLIALLVFRCIDEAHSIRKIESYAKIVQAIAFGVLIIVTIALVIVDVRKCRDAQTKIVQKIVERAYTV